MSLPLSAHQKQKVKLSGGEAEVRGLTRQEALELYPEGGEKPSAVELEIAMIAAGTGETVKDTRDWYAQAASGDVEALRDAIMGLSGMLENSGKGSSAA